MCLYTDYPLIWRNIRITVRHCPAWYSSVGLSVQHIEIISPNSEPLPVTETGYRSHFMCGPDPLADYGGDPVAYVTAWLDYEARANGWKVENQLSLL